jgi:acyl dehydratase
VNEAGEASDVSGLVVSSAAALKQYVNAEVGVTQYLEMSQELISSFADLTGDWQWIHTDVHRARRESPFGGTVAHGFLTLSLCSRFLAEAVTVQGTRLLLSCGLNSVRFLTPVPAAGRIRARVRLREHADGQDFVQATWRITIECEGQRSPCCVADWVVRYYG